MTTNPQAVGPLTFREKKDLRGLVRQDGTVACFCNEEDAESLRYAAHCTQVVEQMAETLENARTYMRHDRKCPSHDYGDCTCNMAKWSKEVVEALTAYRDGKGVQP